MKISTIVTVFNLEKYIEAALQSVFSQTRPPDEIIVIDDCSTDSSASIIHKYHNRVTYIKMPENSGVLTATLTGIKASRGDILSFLDGDDIWMPTKLEEVFNTFVEDKNIALISHNYEIITGNGVLTHKIDVTKRNLIQITQDNPNKEILSHRIKNSILCYKGIWLGSAFCFRRDCFNITLFEKFVADLPLPNYTKLSHQDQPIAAFIALNLLPHQRLFLINKVLFHYRVFGGNSSGASNTLEQAFKTLNRSYATNYGTSRLVSQHPELIEENYRQNYILKESEYIILLYKKSFVKAFRAFVILSIKLWHSTKILKETQRFIGVTLLGTERFLKFKSKKFNI